MSELPFKIPNSLASYREQYEKKPGKTIARLQNHLQKGPDAVGYFLLGWFLLQKGSKDRAIDCALKANALAPGSPFFKKLHYFFSHPDMFDAWLAPAPYRSAGKSRHIGRSAPALNLDSLIKKLSHLESNRFRPKPDFAPKNESLTSDSTNNAGDIVSETLAKVHEQQGNIDAAIHAYRKLKIVKKEKRSFYDKKITALQKIKSEENENN